ncbi:hypothetical protein SKAU_G00332110 [Synaphobranchus kaupii]|uniref:Uncharacterized protein n=1 Tax=Synaphobranchus kaupii TaxID=118154 RepID=A0A9Q1IHN5_SYNKA|nr:hypothetical protein SKAU_G00332110 [Synaphobranchus kaupii]
MAAVTQTLTGTAGLWRTGYVLCSLLLVLEAWTPKKWRASVPAGRMTPTLFWSLPGWWTPIPLCGTALGVPTVTQARHGAVQKTHRCKCTFHQTTKRDTHNAHVQTTVSLHLAAGAHFFSKTECSQIPVLRGTMGGKTFIVCLRSSRVIMQCACDCLKAL